MTYHDAVSEARTLAKRTEADQWRLAQLTWETVTPGSHRSDAVSLARWAKDIGIDDSYASRIYRVWESFSHLVRENRPPFSEAYRQISPHSAHKPQLHNQPVTDQAKAIQQALSNPEVAREVFSDMDTKVNAMGAIRNEQQRRGETPPAPQPSTPTPLDILVELTGAKRCLREAFRSISQLGPDDAAKSQILHGLAEVETEVSNVKGLLTGMNVDEAISKIMEGSA